MHNDWCLIILPTEQRCNPLCCRGKHRQEVTRVAVLGARGGAGVACFAYLSLQGVSYAVEVDGALVCQVVEDVEGTCCLRASLLVAQNKVNPLMQLTRHKLAFQGLSGKSRAIRGERHTAAHNTQEDVTTTQTLLQHDHIAHTGHFKYIL